MASPSILMPNADIEGAIAQLKIEADRESGRDDGDPPHAAAVHDCDRAYDHTIGEILDVFSNRVRKVECKLGIPEGSPESYFRIEGQLKEKKDTATAAKLKSFAEMLERLVP